MAFLGDFLPFLDILGEKKVWSKVKKCQNQNLK